MKTIKLIYIMIRQQHKAEPINGGKLFHKDSCVSTVAFAFHLFFCICISFLEDLQSRKKYNETIQQFSIGLIHHK